MKILWEKDGSILISGFIVGKSREETEAVMAAVDRFRA
jgi:hypothetical protein